MKLSLSVIEMRNLIGDEVLNNSNKYSNFIAGSIEDYVNKNIRKNFQWADEVEIWASESIWKRPILIYNTDGSLKREPHATSSQNTSNDFCVSQPIFLLFSGTDSVDKQNGHYDALLLMS